MEMKTKVVQSQKQEKKKKKTPPKHLWGLN